MTVGGSSALAALLVLSCISVACGVGPERGPAATRPQLAERSRVRAAGVRSIDGSVELLTGKYVLWQRYTSAILTVEEGTASPMPLPDSVRVLGVGADTHATIVALDGNGLRLWKRLAGPNSAWVPVSRLRASDSLVSASYVRGEWYALAVDREDNRLFLASTDGASEFQRRVRLPEPAARLDAASLSLTSDGDHLRVGYPTWPCTVLRFALPGLASDTLDLRQMEWLNAELIRGGAGPQWVCSSRAGTTSATVTTIVNLVTDATWVVLVSEAHGDTAVLAPSALGVLGGTRDGERVLAVQHLDVPEFIEYTFRSRK